MLHIVAHIFLDFVNQAASQVQSPFDLRLHLLLVEPFYLDRHVAVHVRLAIQEDLMLSVELVRVVAPVQVLLLLPGRAQVFQLPDAVLLHAGCGLRKLLEEVEELLALQ